MGEDIVRAINRDELQHGGSSYAFQGHRFGDVNISFYWTDAPPQAGPPLHLHPYEEVFIVQEGQATFTVGADAIEARAPQVLVVPPRTPHKFVNSGEGPLRQISIHASGVMQQQDLE